MKVHHTMYPLCKCRNCGKFIIVKKQIKDTVELFGPTRGIILPEGNSTHWCDNPPLLDDQDTSVNIILDIIGTVEPKEQDNEREE